MAPPRKRSRPLPTSDAPGPPPLEPEAEAVPPRGAVPPPSYTSLTTYSQVTADMRTMIRSGQYFEAMEMVRPSFPAPRDERLRMEAIFQPSFFPEWVSAYTLLSHIRGEVAPEELYQRNLLLNYLVGKSPPLAYKGSSVASPFFYFYEDALRRERESERERGVPCTPWDAYSGQLEGRAAADAATAFQVLHPPTPSPAPAVRSAGPPRSQQVCFNFNSADGCRSRHCNRRHVCRLCEGRGHIAANCPSSRYAPSSSRGDSGAGTPAPTPRR